MHVCMRVRVYVCGSLYVYTMWLGEGGDHTKSLLNAY